MIRSIPAPEQSLRKVVYHYVQEVSSAREIFARRIMEPARKNATIGHESRN
jgi:hypothetical protein